MKGAVQGEATATANTPDKNASITGCLAWWLTQCDGKSCPISNKPNKFSAISVNNTANPLTTQGDCN